MHRLIWYIMYMLGAVGWPDHLQDEGRLHIQPGHEEPCPKLCSSIWNRAGHPHHLRADGAPVHRHLPAPPTLVVARPSLRRPHRAHGRAEEVHHQALPGLWTRSIPHTGDLLLDSNHCHLCLVNVSAFSLIIYYKIHPNITCFDF